VISQFLFLESTDRTKDIQMYINSPGGNVYAGLGMYDTMTFVTPDIATICTGIAASMAAVLMCAGSPGKRREKERPSAAVQSAGSPERGFCCK
jgi:ATP-dependent Clp protease protease subunit